MHYFPWFMDINTYSYVGIYVYFALYFILFMLCLTDTYLVHNNRRREQGQVVPRRLDPHGIQSCEHMYCHAQSKNLMRCHKL